MNAAFSPVVGRVVSGLVWSFCFEVADFVVGVGVAVRDGSPVYLSGASTYVCRGSLPGSEVLGDGVVEFGAFAVPIC